MAEQRVRLVRVDGTLLAQMLLFPERAKVVDACREVFCAGEQIVLRVESPDFAAVEEGHSIPDVCPSYTRDDTGQTAFVSWGP